MCASRPSLTRSLIFLLVLSSIAGSAHAAPKSYSFSGKLTSNRGAFINIPVVGNTPCPGVGLANLTVMAGPGGKTVPAPNTPVGPFPGTSANQSGSKGP